MPASYQIDLGQGIVFCRRWGVLTDGELVAQARALREDLRFDPTFRQIADLRDVLRFDVTADGIRQLADLNPFAKGVRRVRWWALTCRSGFCVCTSRPWLAT